MIEKRQFNIVIQSKPNSTTGKSNPAAMIYTWPDNERLGGVWLNPRDEQTLKSSIRFDRSGRSVRFDYKKFQELSNQMERRATWKKMLTKISGEDDKYEAAKTSLLPSRTKDEMSGDPGTPEFWTSVGGYSAMMEHARRATDAGLGGQKMTLREAKEALGIQDSTSPSGMSKQSKPSLVGGPSMPEQKNDLISHLGGAKQPGDVSTPSTIQTVSTGTPNKTSGNMVQIQIDQKDSWWRAGGAFQDASVTLVFDSGERVAFEVDNGGATEQSNLLEALLKLAGHTEGSRRAMGQADAASVAQALQSYPDEISGDAFEIINKVKSLAGEATAGTSPDDTETGDKPPLTKLAPGLTPETKDPYQDYELGERAGIMHYQRSLMDDNYKRKIGAGDTAVSNANENFGRRRGLGYSANTGAYNFLNRLGITDAKREDVLRNKGRKKLEKANLAGSRYLDLRDRLQGERDIYDEQQKSLELNPDADLSQGSLGGADSFELRRLRRQMGRQERKQGRKMRKFRKKVGRADNLVKKEGRKRAQQLNRYSTDKERGRNARV